VPRENEIMAADRMPDNLRAAAADMGLFGCAIPQEWGGLGLDLRQDVELAIEFGTPPSPCGRCSVPTTA
jgi:acyl-CoA dehydrogenase